VMSNTDPLEREMRQLLLDLELCSHGRTMGLDGRVTGSKDQSPILRSDEEPYPHEEFRARWASARSATARFEVVRKAREALRDLRRTPAPQRALLEPGSLAWKRDIANSSDSVEDLVRVNEISRQTVWRYRKMYREET
jgi:hypothetical protein